jgi:hypothetical protein
LLLQESMNNVGYYVTHGCKDVYMIEFQTLLQECHVRDVCTSTKNPQSNAICKRMHQTVGNVLRTLLHGEPPQNIADAKEFIDEALSIVMHAMRAGIHSTMGSSLGNLVFNRDMFLNTFYCRLACNHSEKRTSHP